jgi:oxygen-independent coproporphyrinogen-3 oxidase
MAAGASIAVERRVMTASERLEEALFTGLRLTAGVDIDQTGRLYGADVWARFGPALQPFIAEGLLVREGPRLRLTREGMLVANEVMQVFV